MSRTLLALVGALACGALGAAADDPVTKKLAAARADYDAKSQKAEAGVTKWLDKREATARAAGDKKVLDQIKTDREAFAEYGVLPRGTPDDLRKQLTGARAALEAAMVSTVKDLTKLKRDEEATAVEAALLEFRKQGWRHVDTAKATFKDDHVRVPTHTEVTTVPKFDGGFEVVVVARTESENIRLYGPRGSSVIFNWEANPRELRVCRPDGGERPESGSIATAKVTPLKPNTWYTLRWRVTETGTQVSVDGKVVFEEQRANDLNAPGPVAVRAMGRIVDLKEFQVTPLAKAR